MLAWLIAGALAAPVLGIHATGGVGQQAEEVDPWLGGGATVFAPVAPRVALGGRAEVGYVDRFGFALLPQARLQPMLSEGPSLELVVGAGVLSQRTTHAALTLGAGAALPLGDGALQLRVEGTWVRALGDGPTRFLLSVGLESSKRAAPPPPEPPTPESEPPTVVDVPPLDLFDDDEVADPTASLDLLLPTDLGPVAAPVDSEPVAAPQEPNTSRASMVTIAWPECQLVTPLRAAEILSSAPPDEQVLVRVGAGLPVSGAASELATALPEPVDQGSLLVVAWPGDTVTVAGRTVAVASDGFAVVQLPEDAHQVTVVGGGRRHAVEVAIAAGHGTWVRAPEPAPVRFGFQVNQANLTAADRRELTQFGKSAGTWSFTVQGGYSPEGKLDRNLDLASRRAEAAVQVLTAAGVPSERIRVLAPAPPDPTLSPTLQRKTVVTPVKEAP